MIPYGVVLLWLAMQYPTNPGIVLPNTTGTTTIYYKLDDRVFEPIDIPAIQVKDGHSFVTFGGELIPRWTCADKSRILLTAEDDTRWCHKVQP